MDRSLHDNAIRFLYLLQPASVNHALCDTYQTEPSHDHDRDQIQHILQINLCVHSNQSVLIRRLIGLQQVRLTGIYLLDHF